jgi:ABC-type amino acid transport system permease subunit
MGQRKSSVAITILAVAAVYFILVFVLVQMIRILENWSQIYP